MIEQARRTGGRLIVIDPYRTRTAALADWHIAIRPGTDGALALGMMHVILNEGLEDRAFIAERTHGFDGLAERVKEYTPERVAEWTGMTAGEIEGLAREYATKWPTTLRVNYGMQRTENGGEAMRAIAMLPALTGAWKHRGGGGGISLSGAFKFDEDALRRLDLAMASSLKRLARTVNMCELGEALEERGYGVSGVGYRKAEIQALETEGQGPGTEGLGTRGQNPPVKALFVYNSNPGAVAPDQNAVRRGLKRADLFTVVHDLFFNDTTDYADYVLPATTFLEHTDIQGAYGHYYVGLSQQAIEPAGEARSNMWLFGQLGQRMGFEEACFRDTPEEMVKQALRIGANGYSQNPEMEHISLEDLKERGHIPLAFHRNAEREPFLPYTAGTLATPSGKIEFDSEVLKARGLDGLPGFKPPTESRWGEDAKRFPLEFLSRKADNYMNSTFANLDGHRKMEARTSQRLEMHPADAATRGISEGDAVRIWNGRGEMRLTAMLNAHLPAGVVAGKLDWGKMNAEGNNVNALTSQRLTDIGAGATFYSTLVEVGKE